MSEESIRRVCWQFHDFVMAVTWGVTLAVLLWRRWSITRRWFVGGTLTLVIFTQFTFLIAVAPELFTGRTTLGNYNLTLGDALPSLAGCLLGHALANAVLRRTARQIPSD